MKFFIRRDKNEVLVKKLLMKNILRQIVSFILPVTVLILIPLDIERNISVRNYALFFIGLIIMIIGLFLLVMTVGTFIRVGKGTLAPWSPPKKLVFVGMYGYVRNPMITGVLIVLTGESIAILSFNIFIEAIIFFIINNIFFVIYEEPNLQKRFGDEYMDYKRNVPRWIPRLKPYNTDSELINK